MKIAIGCNNNAINMKNVIIKVLEKNEINYKDFGVKNIEPIDYIDIAIKIAKEVQNSNFDRGILLSGTGIGMAICANKFKGIRAACCHDSYSIKKSILTNSCQIITIGSHIIGNTKAIELIEIWLSIKSTKKKLKQIKKIEALEKKINV